MEEGRVEVVASLEADEQAAVAMEPGEVPLDDPAVSAELGLGLDALAGDARGDAATTKGATPRTGIVRLVSMELVGTTAWSSAWLLDRRDRIDHVEEDRALVDVRGRLEAGEGDPLPITRDVILRPWFATVGRARPHRLGRRPPFFTPFAGIVVLSTLTRLQSIRSASPSRSSSTRCSAYQTPASCQSRSRRQQVIPLPHPSSCGRYSHGIPVFSTNTIPVRHARSGTRGRPAFFLGPGRGNNGSTTDHSSSLTSILAMQQMSQGPDHFC
jgi:hypothetical protein